jgi:hypothetical protein
MCAPQAFVVCCEYIATKGADVSQWLAAEAFERARNHGTPGSLVSEQQDA